MSSIEPKTRHLRAAELRKQLEQMLNPVRTRTYSQAERMLVKDSMVVGERTAHHRIARSGPARPMLGRAVAGDVGCALVTDTRLHAPLPSVRSRTSQPKTKRRKSWVMRRRFWGGAFLIMVVGGALFGLWNWLSHDRSSAPPSVSVAATRRAGMERARERTDREPSVRAVSPGAPSATKTDRKRTTLDTGTDDWESSVSSSREGTAGVTPRLAVEHLVMGRLREALEAYRALSHGPHAHAELGIVATLLEAEISRCTQETQGQSSCVP